MGDPVGVDLVTLVAPLATAVAAAVCATWRERIRWRRAIAADARHRELATRRALRLVERELHEAESRIGRVAGKGYFAPVDRNLATHEWGEHRGRLAEELGVADWHRVTAAYDAIVDLNETLDQRLGSLRTASPENLGQAVTSAVAEAHLRGVRDDDRLKLRWHAIRTASWILRAYAGEAEEVDWTLTQDRLLAQELWPPEPSVDGDDPVLVRDGRTAPEVSRDGPG